MAHKIKLGIYSYSYVRVVAMKSKLLKKDDYQKLMKMKLSEIARYLEESEYKKEIDELGISYSGAFLLELAVQKNLIRSFNQLKRVVSISGDDLKTMIQKYMLRRDIWNLKTLLRAKFTGIPEKELANHLVPVETYTEDELLEIYRKEGIEEILKHVHFIKYKDIRPAVDYFNENNSLNEIENFLDRLYYELISEFTQTIPKEGELFKEFLLNEIFIQNIITTLRMKRANMDKETMKKYIIKLGHRKFDRTMSKMIDAENFDDIIGVLNSTHLKNEIQEGIKMYEEKTTLVYLESDLWQYLLKRSSLLLHQHPLSASIILGYMLAKEIEVKNLNMLIKGRQLNLSDEFIENSLVMT